MRKTFVILGVLVISFASSYSQQVAKSLTASNGEFIGFLEYKPTDYNTGTKYPLIIFLHGIGERGNGTTDLQNVAGLGIPGNIKNGHTMRFFWNGKWETFLVLSPQLSTKYGWWPTFYVEEMINYATKNLSVDPNRIFLTGLSLGGGGVWSYALSSPENAKKLAAIGVSCGTCQNGNWGNIANAHLPTWAWHAADDGTVGAGCSTSAINNINSYNPAVKPYLTIWPTGNHWIWGRVYSTGYDAQHPNIYEWFLGQNKSLPVNQRPVANAGPDQTISKLLGTATLNGSGSRDPDGSIVQYVWSKVSGPSAGLISAAVSVGSTTLITGLTTPGTYVYELRAIDNRADWAVDQVTITVSDQIIPTPVGNQSPVAKAGNDVTITLPTNSVNLNASGSSDPDGSITSYAWSKVAGPSQFTLNNPTSATASVTNLVQGTYTFRVTVKDNNNAASTDDVNIIVKAATTPVTKVANAGADATITLPTNSVTLNATASSDPAGPIRQYEWIKVSGPSQYTIADTKAATTTLSNLARGIYKFRVVVWDHNWIQTTDTVAITVNPNPTRMANAGSDMTITLPTNSVTMNGSVIGGEIITLEWKKLSGPSATIADPRSLKTAITGLVEGTYSFELRVWNMDWTPYADTVIVKVSASGSGSGNGSISNAGPDIYLTLPINSTMLNGSASYNPQGILAYEWTRIDGPRSYNIFRPNLITTPLTNLVEGVYRFKLTVWNQNRVPYYDTVVVVVKGSGAGGNSGMAKAGRDIFITLPVNSTTLNGSASADPTGAALVAYQWRKLFGPAQYSIVSPKSATTALTNLAQGIYSFELRVWNKVWTPYADTVNVIVMSSGVTTSAAIGTTDAVMTTRTSGAGATTVNKLMVYPNPAHGILNVQTISQETGKATINIYDVTGRNVQQVSFEKSQSLQQRSLNITRLAPGVYHLEVIINDKRKMITKFIKQ